MQLLKQPYLLYSFLNWWVDRSGLLSPFPYFVCLPDSYSTVLTGLFLICFIKECHSLKDREAGLTGTERLLVWFPVLAGKCVDWLPSGCIAMHLTPYCSPGTVACGSLLLWSCAYFSHVYVCAHFSDGLNAEKEFRLVGLVQYFKKSPNSVIAYAWTWHSEMSLLYPVTLDVRKLMCSLQTWTGLNQLVRKRKSQPPKHSQVENSIYAWKYGSTHKPE